MYYIIPQLGPNHCIHSVLQHLLNDRNYGSQYFLDNLLVFFHFPNISLHLNELDLLQHQKVVDYFFQSNLQNLMNTKYIVMTKTLLYNTMYDGYFYLRIQVVCRQPQHHQSPSYHHKQCPTHRQSIFPLCPQKEETLQQALPHHQYMVTLQDYIDVGTAKLLYRILPLSPQVTVSI